MIEEAQRYTVAASAVGIDALDLRVVADLLGVDRAERFAIREALGAGGEDEALAVGGDDGDGGPALGAGELESSLCALVRATGVLARTTRPLVSDRAIMTGAPTWSARLQARGVDRPNADRIACRAADVAAEALDGLLIMHIGRARTYRQAGETDVAERILLTQLAGASEKDDWADMARYFLADVSEAHTGAGRPHEGVVAAGVAVADIPGLLPVSMTEARVAIARLGQAAVALDQHAPRLLRATAFIGRRVTPNWDKTVKDDFRRYEGMADDLDVPECDAAGACQWLGEAVATAYSEADDEEVQDLLGRMFPDGVLGFSVLQHLVGR